MKSTTTLKDENFSIARGALAAAPIVLGYLPVAFALGILASQTGFTLFRTFLLFALCFSGSGQSIALQLLALAQPIFAIFSTTVIINLRYFLMSAALAPYLAGWPKLSRLLFSVFITDEIFALHCSQFPKAVPPRSYVFAANVTAWTSWYTGGVLGFLAGAYVADVKPFGFDFAVPSMFIALVVLQLANPLTVLLAILGATLTVLLAMTKLSSWAIILSSMLCALLGTLVELWKNNSR